MLQPRLAGDTTQLTTTTNIDSEATWADYRARNTANYNQTHNWHFVDELRDPATSQANDWAIETYSVSKVNAYGPLPAPGARRV